MAILNIRYYIDPETGLPHIYNHNVTEAEVEEVLARPVRIARDMREPDWPSDRRKQDDIFEYICP